MQIEQLIEVVKNALDDMKAKDVTIIDVRGRSTVTDYMIIASGTSRRHVVATADHVTDECKKAGTRPIGVEGQESGDWILVDVGDVVVHVMMPDARGFYELERLWAFSDPESVEAQG